MSNETNRLIDVAGLKRLALWVALTVVSIAAAVFLKWAHIPAALMIGPMLVAICAGAMGVNLKLWPQLTAVSYAVIGMMIAVTIKPAFFGMLLDNWPVVVAVAVATVAASTALGVWIGRRAGLPSATAILGSVPGAAPAMVILADDVGADARLVAFMQYVRVVTVSLTAALIASLLGGMSAPAQSPAIWFPPIAPISLGVTVLVAAGGYVLGRLVRLPSPAFLGPLIVGVIVHAGAGMELQLPQWLLAFAFLILGWSVGLRFDRATLFYSVRRLPQILLALLVLVGFCGAVSWTLVTYLGVDPLTAYLAVSPGGIDMIAIIAAASVGVDFEFVMALQAMRFVIILICGPPLARWLALRASV